MKLGVNKWGANTFWARFASQICLKIVLHELYLFLLDAFGFLSGSFCCARRSKGILPFILTFPKLLCGFNLDLQPTQTEWDETRDSSWTAPTFVFDLFEALEVKSVKMSYFDGFTVKNCNHAGSWTPL